jgi:Spy/CpxP family protein refolding chaperone
MGGMLGLGPGLGELNLSDAQRDQFREVRSRYREETRGVVARLAEVRRKLREAVETVPVNEGLIMGVTQDLVQAEIDAALQEARLNAEVWSVLTPEQQARAVKLRAERQARMEERRERMEQRRGR